MNTNDLKEILEKHKMWLNKEEPFMPPMTNADRIRSMSNEELSKFLGEFRSCDSDGYPCSGCKAERYCYAGHTGMKDWLQQPAEEEDTYG